MSAKSTAVPTTAKRRPPAKNTGAPAPTPMAMLQVAVEQGQDLERIEKLMQMEREWKADRAREAFYEAKSEFKKADLSVIKDKLNKQYGSRYSSIGNFVSTVNAAMAPYGLNASWDFEQGDTISVTCILTHTMGHSERVTLCGPPDTSGSKNSLQQIKSTITYLEIATYQAVTGVVAQDANLDDDGNAAGEPKPVVDEKQVKELKKLLKDAGRDIDAFLQYCEVEKIEECTVENFEYIVPKLKKAIKADES